MAEWIEYKVVKVVVADEGLYVGTGAVNRWVSGINAAFGIAGRDHAPVNKRANTGHGAPGMMRDSVVAEVEHVGPRQLQSVLSVNVPYALYVIRGTTGPIYSNKGFRFAANRDKRLRGPFKVKELKTKTKVKGRPDYFMHLPINPQFGGGRAFHSVVSGQDANNFLIAAYNQVGRRHSALRPMSPGFLSDL